MPLDQLLLFIAAGLLLNLTPGPDVLYVVTHALRSGARVGIVAALGITAGCFVHIVAAALGVSALMAASATAFMVLKWAGALYLVYLGLRMLLSGKQSATLLGAADAFSTRAVAAFDPKNAAGDMAVEMDLHTDSNSGTALHSHMNSPVNVFAKGFATNALNPKVALFFLAFLPQFIAPGVVNKPLAFFLLGLLFTFNGMWVNIGWAVATAWVSRKAHVVQNSMLWLDRVAGTLFIVFGLKLALTDNPTS
jgi:threonine/homoserine/homoserine lactone efflux protein